LREAVFSSISLKKGEERVERNTGKRGMKMAYSKKVKGIKDRKGKWI